MCNILVIDQLIALENNRRKTDQLVDYIDAPYRKYFFFSDISLQEHLLNYWRKPIASIKTSCTETLGQLNFLFIKRMHTRQKNLVV